MAELVRTNDPGVISVEGLLGGADIPYQVTDRNMSILEVSARGASPTGSACPQTPVLSG